MRLRNGATRVIRSGDGGRRTAHPLAPTTAAGPPAAHARHALGRLRAEMGRRGFAAVVAFSGENVYYATGFASPSPYGFGGVGAAAAIVFRDQADGRVLVDSENWAASCPAAGDLAVIAYPMAYVDDPYGTGLAVAPSDTPEDAVEETMRRVAAIVADVDGRVAVDRSALSQRAWEALARRARDRDLPDAGPAFTAAREVKSAWEVEQLTRAHGIAERAIAAARAAVAEGVTGRDLHHVLMRACWADDATTAVRSATVTVGKDVSLLAFPQRQVPARAGDLVKLDLSVDVLGYGADIARTACVGSPVEDARRAHAAVQRGHRALLRGAERGRPLADLYREVLAVVRGQGLRAYRRRHFGHGVGLSRVVEEHPLVAATAEDDLQPGMVLALEVPYYAYGLGNLNVESMVVVEEERTRVLTTLPTGL